MHEDRRYLLDLAARIDRGADELDADATDPRGTLEARDYHLPEDEIEAFGARHAAAGKAARQYSARLREEATADIGPVPAERIRQAEKVATAAGLGGILIDGSRLDEAAMASPSTSDAQRQAIEDHTRAERAAIEGSGMFTHVAEPGQVPYWQLRQADQDTAGHGDARERGVAHGYAGGPYDEALFTDPEQGAAYRAGLQAGRTAAVDETLLADARQHAAADAAEVGELAEPPTSGPVDDGHRYALAGPRGVSEFLDNLDPDADHHTITVYGSADLARRMADAHTAGVCVAFQRLDEPDPAATTDRDEEGWEA